MCGIFGIALLEHSGVSSELFSETLRRLYKLSQSRGTEATGLAVLGSEVISVVKNDVPAAKFIRSKEYQSVLSGLSSDGSVSGPLAVIGHSRMVTNGSQECHDNNQPVIAESCVGIHNGIIVNDEKIWRTHPDLKRKYQVDTEAIFSLLGKYYEESHSVPLAVSKTFSELEGQASIAGFFRSLNCLLLATNNGSLYYLESKDRPVFIFASERQILRRLIDDPNLKAVVGSFEISQLKPGTAVCVNLEPLRVQLFSLGDNVPGFIAPKNGLVRNVDDVLLALKNRTSPQVSSDDGLLGKVADRWGHDTTFADSLRRCSKCILPETMPFIEFNHEGVCNYCTNYRKIELYGREKLSQLADQIRRTDGQPDCLVGLSGGRDSCYGLHYLKKELGLNPVAYTYDWGMVTDLARRNISRMCGKLGVEHILVSARIARKRSYVRKNVEAWLKKPELGMIPLFMAGDKAYFYHASRLKKELDVPTIFLCENMLERTDFKSGFAGVKPANIDPDHVYTLTFASKAKIALYYLTQYLKNPAYINASLLDSAFAYACYYLIDRDYANLFKYIPWEEEKIVTTLRNEYDWELSPDTKSTWRIGDGTAAFYNYIYYRVAGFTENETFRSNQIREGLITRPRAIELSREENKPRYQSIKWYCDTNGINFERDLETIAQIPKLK